MLSAFEQDFSVLFPGMLFLAYSASTVGGVKIKELYKHFPRKRHGIAPPLFHRSVADTPAGLDAGVDLLPGRVLPRRRRRGPVPPAVLRTGRLRR